jgi:hypothetical protein
MENEIGVTLNHINKNIKEAQVKNNITFNVLFLHD